MEFNKDSKVTIVLTSCGRFDLLERTLKSIDTFNTYPVKEVIFTEDSGDEKIYDVIPENWKPYCKVFINKPGLGQLKSIDLAYENVSTEYIFHCEDDWEFYRYHFIEDSLKILESDTDIHQVWLRSYHHDVRSNCLMDGNQLLHTLGKHKVIDNVGYHVLECHSKKWQGFSFNPGLRRISDYHLVKPFSQYIDGASGESKASIKFAALGKYPVILENSAVLHTGWHNHVTSGTEIDRQKWKMKKHRVLIICGFIAGMITGYLIAS